MRSYLFFLFFLFSSGAWAGERIFILDLGSSGSIPEELTKNFRQSMSAGLEGAGFEVIPAEDVERLYRAYPELERCHTLECLNRLGALLRASRAVDGEVDSEGNNYSFVLRLTSLPQGKILRAEQSCDICTLAEATETLSLLASSLIGKATLSPAERKGKLFVVTEPPGVEIFAQKVLLGQSPTILDLPPGEQKLLLKKKGYKSVTRVVRLEGEEDVILEETLHRKRVGTLRVVVGSVAIGLGILLLTAVAVVAGGE